MSDHQPGWWPDPTQRHEYRYWDGQAWTDVVADHGVESRDPVTPAATTGAWAQPSGSSGASGGSSGGMVVPSGEQAGARQAGARQGGSLSPAVVTVVLMGVAVAGVLVGVLLGRGGGSSTSSGELDLDRQQMLDVLSNRLYSNFEGAITHEEADCAGDTLMDMVGEDRLTALGFGPTNPYDTFSVLELTIDEQRDVVSGVLDCISDGRLVGYLASTYSSGGELTYEEGECIAQRQIELLGPDRLRELAVEGNFNPDESMASLADADEQEEMEAIDRECTEAS